MSEMINWIREIFVVIISVNMLEMLLPEGSVQKYIKFIFSIIIMAILVDPLAAWIQK